jgi:hypothetical protein
MSGNLRLRRAAIPKKEIAFLDTVYTMLGTQLWDMALWTQISFSHNFEGTESLKYVSRWLNFNMTFS